MSSWVLGLLLRPVIQVTVDPVEELWKRTWSQLECSWAESLALAWGSLTCCSPWGRRVRHDWATELNWTDPYLRWVLFLAIKYLLNNIWGERVYLGNLHNQSDNLKQAFSYNKYSALSSFTMDLFYYKCEDRDASWPEYINKNCSMRGRRCF